MNNISAVLTTFVELAGTSPVAQSFLGPLAVLIDSSDTIAHLFVLHDDKVTVVKTLSDMESIQAMGLAYAIEFKDDREVITTRYWLVPSMPKDKVNSSIALLLRAAARETKAEPHPYFTLSAFHTTYEDAAKAAVTKVEWNDGEVYEIHQQEDIEAMPKHDSHPLGHTWIDPDTSDVYVMDVVKETDAQRLIELATVDYEPDYIEFLVKHPILSQFMRVVRLQKTGQVLSSCVIHGDFSLGMVSTDPNFLRRGLANQAVFATLDAVHAYIRAQHEKCPGFLGIRPYSLIKIGNEPSVRMMAKFGFRPSSAPPVKWMGIIV